MNRRQLYAFGEPLGECVTRKEAGRLICGGGGGGGKQTTTQTIPNELKPLASAYADRAMQVGNTPFTPYTQQRFASVNPLQQAGMGMTYQRAMNGSPVMDQANQTMMGKLQGGQTNPYLDSLVGKAQSSVAENYNTMIKPQMETAMVNSGSFGNSGLQQMQGMQQKAAAQQMSDIATSMYGNAYNTDQANQMQALGMAPTYGNQAYNDAQQLMGIGQFAQNQAQNQLDFNYQQFQDATNQPYKNLQVLGAPFTGVSFGGTSTTTSSGGK